MYSPITKYAFRIKTRQGVVVDNLMIHDRPLAAAKDDAAGGTEAVS